MVEEREGEGMKGKSNKLDVCERLLTKQLSS